MKPLKIAIGVGGRFHSDRMALALNQLGHEARLFSSLPSVVFPEPVRGYLQSILYPEVIYRTLKKLGKERQGADFKMAHFGKRLASKLAQDPWDIFIGWSSFSKEAIEKRVASQHILMRDSTHITYQMDILAREYDKLGLSFERDVLAEARELEEYQIADKIFLLSEFAERSFIAKGVSKEKLKLLRLGVDTSLFQPAMRKRKEGGPLKVVYFGALSVRKGTPYLLECSKKFQPREVQFFCVGSVDPELEKIVSQYPQVHFYPAMAQPVLAEFLRQMDVFLFPTLEDGFGQTLIQAMASGLMPITTPNCGASELVSSEEAMIVEPASTQALEDALSQILKAPERLDYFKNNSVKKAEEIQWASYQKRLEDFFGLGSHSGVA